MAAAILFATTLKGTAIVKKPLTAAALLVAATAVFGSTDAVKPLLSQSGEPSGQSDNNHEVYYPNCAAARAAGAAPIHVGEPGYRRKLDRDRDGVACE